MSSTGIVIPTRARRPELLELIETVLRDESLGMVTVAVVCNGEDPDCNTNSIPDTCEIADGSVEDCNDNGVPDSCDIDSGFEADDNENGIPDACEIAAGDLNLDGCIDGGDLAVLLGLWGLPNPPIGDLNNDGLVDGGDLLILLGAWGGCG